MAEVRLNVKVAPDLHRAAKVHAAQRGETLQALVVRLLAEEVGKPAMVMAQTDVVRRPRKSAQQAARPAARPRR